MKRIIVPSLPSSAASVDDDLVAVLLSKKLVPCSNQLVSLDIARLLFGRLGLAGLAHTVHGVVDFLL